jgi:hypothetical protein
MAIQTLAETEEVQRFWKTAGVEYRQGIPVRHESSRFKHFLKSPVYCFMAAQWSKRLSTSEAIALSLVTWPLLSTLSAQAYWSRPPSSRRDRCAPPPPPPPTTAQKIARACQNVIF